MKCLTMAVAVLAAMTCGYSLAQAEKKWQGNQPFTPTKMDWALVNLNAINSAAAFDDAKNGVECVFVHGKNPNTISMKVIYKTAGTAPKFLEQRCARMNAMVESFSKTPGFGWIELTEDKVGVSCSPVGG